MKKILPVTDQCEIMTYTFYSYLEAIIANKYRTGNIAAILEIENYVQDDWKYYSNKLNMCLQEKRIMFTTNRFNLGMNALLYRDLHEEDELNLNIIYQQYSKPLGYISIFITDDENIRLGSTYLYEFGALNNGELLVREGNVEKKIDIFKKGFKNLVLQRKQNKVSLINRNRDTGENEYIQEILVDNVNTQKSLKVGVNIELSDNSYYAWYFSNFIQLKWKIGVVSLEFDLTIRRNWNYYTDNNFIRYGTEYIKTINSLGINMVQYIKNRIDNEIYIELWMDDYDLIGTRRYRKRHNKHQCLIYGYNDDDEIIYVLSTNMRKPFRTKITNADFMKQIANCNPKDIIVSEVYEPDPFEYKFMLRYLIDSLQKYINGEAVINRGILVSAYGEVYGIDIYKSLRTKEGIEILLKDIRNAHLLYEHKICMINRVDYLIAKGFVQSEEMKDELDSAQRIKDLAFTLRTIILKNQMVEDKNIHDKLIQILEKMETEERALYKNLICKLQIALTKNNDDNDGENKDER